MYHYRICFSKTGWLKYISHLDLQRTFIRILRRACIPVGYKKGFNPQPRLSIASPLPIGMEGKNEYLDLFLTRPWGETIIKEAMRKQCPAGIEIREVIAVDLKSPPVSATVEAAFYEAHCTVSSGMDEKIGAMLAADKIIKKRRGKKGKIIIINIRPFILDLKIRNTADFTELGMFLAAGNRGGARPDEILELLEIGKEYIKKICRQELFIKKEEGGLKNPSGITYEEYLVKHLNSKIS